MNKDMSKLDPKLKEAYDRVMGTSITPPQPPKPEHQEVQHEELPQHQPTMATVNPAPQNSSSPTSIHKAMGVKKKSGFSPLILALLGLLFFVAYSIIWVKVFNFKVPFLNP